MATFIKNTDKFGKASWQVKIRRKGFPSQTRTFAAKAQAQEWARSIETAMDRAEHPTTREAEQTTLGQILARYRDEVVPTPRGSKYEVQRISQLLRHPLAQSTMADLTPSKIANWRDDRLRTVSASSVLREMTILRSAIKRARTEWGIALREHPITHVAKPKDNPPREHRISHAEEAILYEGCKKARNPYLRPAIEFALLHTAMRQGEIVALKWKYVDWERRTARLPMTKNGRSRVRAAVKPRHRDIAKPAR